MGKATFDVVSVLLNDIIKSIDSYLIRPLTVSTQTVCFKLVINLINLHTTVRRLTNCTFEAELFPALSITLWKPLHVNVFSNGKVVILGKDALKSKNVIEEWLTINCK